jgi:aspartyl-tRNA(Asn)/glutamyl-tRNA(Gln) amidotransferase subunit A
MKTTFLQTLRKQLDNKEKTVEQVVMQCIATIQEKDSNHNAIIEIYEKDEFLNNLIAKAQAIIDGGKQTEVTGIPFIVKDNLLIKGKIASAGSKILSNYIASYTATAVQKLIDAGAILIARSNMDEFAMGSSNETSSYGPAKHPTDTARVPGGSSGGSAIATALDYCGFSLGTDTGGSVCQPAAFCGICGLYPTYGSVSRSGAIAMASSLDQIGPMAQSVCEIQSVFDIMKGFDILDATSQNAPEMAYKKVETIGIPFDLLESGVNEEVKKVFLETVEKLKEKGFSIISVSIPSAKHALAMYYAIMPAEASTNLARFDGIRYGKREGGENLFETYCHSRGNGIGKETRRRILLGSFTLSKEYSGGYYVAAKKAREILRQEYKRAFEKCDVMLVPTTPTTAFELNAILDPLEMYAADMFTVPSNLTGTPALSVPIGFDANKLPIGIKIGAPHFCEERLFELGKIIEELS